MQLGSQESFVSKVARVRRQAGYVYDKPAVSFDLPTRATSFIMNTQAPTVDRTQTQMMYYAYSAPAAGGTINIGASSRVAAGISGASTASTSAGVVGGYDNGAQNSASVKAQSTQATGSTQAASVPSSSAGTPGYGYSAPSIGNVPAYTGIQQSNNVGSSEYGYKAPSVLQVTNNIESTQLGNGVSSETGLIAGSGYEYNTLTNTQGSGVEQSTDVSTNAPKYLPPRSGGGSSPISPGTVGISGETSGINSGSTTIVTQPLDQYLPPPFNIPNTSGTPVVNQYLTPNVKPESLSKSSQASGTTLVNKDEYHYSGLDPSSNYIPPTHSFTLRPFAPAPSEKYLPPIANSQASGSIVSSTPASPYLPPVH